MTGPLGAELPTGGEDSVVDAVLVHANHRLVVDVGVVLQQGLTPGDAGIVEDNVEVTELGDGCRDGGLDLRKDRHIHADRRGGARGARVEFAGDGPGPLEVDVRNHHLGALGDELLHRGQPDPTRAAGDQGDLVVQPHVLVPLLTSTPGIGGGPPIEVSCRACPTG